MLWLEKKSYQEICKFLKDKSNYFHSSGVLYVAPKLITTAVTMETCIANMMSTLLLANVTLIIVVLGLEHTTHILNRITLEG